MKNLVIACRGCVVQCILVVMLLFFYVPVVVALEATEQL